ncbi:uncharacterized protein LOC110173639 isoform X3 [Boleophthalmus pectinirostris]|uniref:uncharacterized protein LOC110173639 isoform X2 n=1 Tax=Boleophthalmus pectinirostris TaxID=150288 RepID=UPI00242B7B99|nr:uncharacterized protein LOC110173639 isoform X2 [Boleophthalmus pectinirostris]XP_055018369.1 uncharacterized protein LOC110173639 isoform X3 [Boleophthalmus pectinirostris]
MRMLVFCVGTLSTTTKLSLHISPESDLYVDEQSITAVLGGSVTVVCHYAKKDQFHWCMFDGQCISTSGQMTNDMEVSIKARGASAKVTMKKLKQEHSGWYFCQNGGFQMPVNLTVMREVTTTAPTTMPFVTSVTQLSTSEPSTVICTNTTTGGQPVNSSSIMTTEVNLHPIHTKSQSTVIVIACVAVFVLLLFVIAVFAALKMAVCRKRIPTESRTAEGPHTVSNQSVIYSNIFLNQEPSDNKKGPHTVTDEDVIYSTVSDYNKSSQTVTDQDVIYSNIFVTQKTSDNNKSSQTVTDQDVIYSNIFVTQKTSDNNKDGLSEASVIYATVVKHNKSQQMARQAEESVIYSTVSK